MLKHPQVTESRIENALARLREWIYPERTALTVEAYHVGGEPVSFTEATAQKYQPFHVGQKWGPAWDTTWFRFSGNIPAEWKGREVVALVRLAEGGTEGFTAEGLAWRDGRPLRAINVNRSDVPLALKAQGGEGVVFYVEAAANAHLRNKKPSSGAGVDAGGDRLFSLALAEMACMDREAWSFYHDFRVAFGAMRALADKEPRRGQLRYALNAALNVLDSGEEKQPFRKARRELSGVLNCQNGDTAHEISAIGHAHIDTAWLWPLRESIRKCARTFATALAYMEEYPRYVFGCSQAQHYAWMKAHYPAIYEGIRKAVKRGQWEPIGSLWIETDCNIPSGESIVRQILRGKAFFQDEFGIETRDVWIPDVFGYPASMPQILRKAGVDYFLTQKMSWSQFNRFPHHTFLWEGIDGTRVFSHFPPADTYNGAMTPEQLTESLHNFSEHDRSTRSLYVYGFGDGGGGPTKEMLETAQRLRDFEGLPRVWREKVAEFFRKAEKEARDLPVWVGELYLEFHRGTYTSQARNKRANRKCEFLLHDAEFFEALAGAKALLPEGLEAGVASPRAVYDTGGKSDLDHAWKLLLLNQFHDIIPGSSIHWVYEDSARDYLLIRDLAGRVADRARSAIAGTINTSGCSRPYIVFNTSGFAREEVMSLPDGSPAFVEVPACGYVVIDASRTRPVGSFARPVAVTEYGGTIQMDNGFLHVEIDAAGCLASVFDQRVSRQVLEPGRRGNVFQIHPDIPNQYDAWEVEVFYRETCRDILSLDKLEVIERHPLRAVVRVERRFGKSRIVQRIVMRAASARLDFETEVEWREERRFLKVAFPLNVRSMRATYEIQFGHVERPTHHNTSWDLARFEVCAQKWADLSEGNYGVALLNDCKYGYDIHDSVMRLSLLRAPKNPDPVADLGRHEFTYALLPHRAGFRQGEVIPESYALNQPLHVLDVAAHDGPMPPSLSFVSVDRPGTVIETVKMAEKDRALVVRLYEAHGTRGPVRLKTALPVRKACTTDLLERPETELRMEKGEVELTVTPFEIVTLKLFL